MRATEPIDSGQLQLNGFQIGYKAYGDRTSPAVLLLPIWPIVHSEVWKMQVAYLSRSFRVITYDPPGNGHGQRTTDPAGFEFERIGHQGLGILDHLGIQRTSVVGYSRGSAFGIWLAAAYPERVERMVLVANGVTPEAWGTTAPGYLERRETYEGWEKENVHYWREHYDDWLEFFFSHFFSEPHSTKGIEDGTRWAWETTVDILAASVARTEIWPTMPSREAIAGVQCPVLMVHGSDDRRYPISASHSLAAVRPDWDFVILEGSGHIPICREPVRLNLLLHSFLSSSPRQSGGV